MTPKARRPDPTTPAEWQEAADAAVFCIGVHSARAYGLVATDLDVDVDRCEDILRRAPFHGALVRPLEAVLSARLGVDEWPNDEEMAKHCGGEDPDHLYGGGCGHMLGQHHYGDNLAPCHFPGCRCQHFR